LTFITNKTTKEGPCKEKIKQLKPQPFAIPTENPSVSYHPYGVYLEWKSLPRARSRGEEGKRSL